MSVITKIDETLSWLDEKILEPNLSPEGMLSLALRRAALLQSKPSTTGEGGGSSVTAEEFESSVLSALNASQINTDTSDLSEIAATLSKLYAAEYANARGVTIVANNTDIAGTIASPPPGEKYYLKSITVSYDADPDVPKLVQISWNNTILFRVKVSSKGVGPLPLGIRLPSTGSFFYTMEASGTPDNLSHMSIAYSTIPD